MSYNHLHVTRGEAGQFQSHNLENMFIALPNHPYWMEKSGDEIRMLADVVSDYDQVERLIDLTGDDWNWQQYYGFYRRVRLEALRLTVAERSALTAEAMYELAKGAVPDEAR